MSKKTIQFLVILALTLAIAFPILWNKWLERFIFGG